MVRASDKQRLRAMEREISDCRLDRYYGDRLAFDAENNDVATMREDMFKYLESRSVESAIPTYFHYWDDEDYRRRLWLLQRDPIARGMLMKIQRVSSDIIDGRAAGRLKRVGDGSHLPSVQAVADEDRSPRVANGRCEKK
jgi:hypothetical protein